MRTSWRLSGRFPFEAVDKRFEAVDKRFEDLIHMMDKRFDGVDKRFEDMQKSINRTQWIVMFGFSLLAALAMLLKFLPDSG